MENAVTSAETLLHPEPPLQSGETCSAPPIPLAPSLDDALLSANCTSCIARMHMCRLQGVQHFA